MRTHLFASLAVLLLISCKPGPSSTTSSSATTASTGTTAPLSATTGTAITNPPPTQQPPLDHFKFWRVKPPEALNVSVQLQGQFEEKPWKAIVKSAVYIGNPVEKIAEGKPPNRISNPDLHYVAYQIAPAPGTKLTPPPPVFITNQFGTRIPWQLGAPTLLLVPADKSLKGPTEKKQPGNHFVCYVALNEQQAHVPVTLHDEFDDAMHKTEAVHDFLAKYLCVPTSKQLNDKPPEGVTDEKTHLALYLIQGTPFNRPAWTNDQFNHYELNVLDSELLGVPSEKEIVAKPAPKP